MAHAQFLSVAHPHDNHQRQATPPTDQRPASSASTHAKVCTQCGTTRTPQWREGPLGPKTLCNACGVKQFRQFRQNKKATRDEPTKRRPPTPTTQHKRKADSAPRPPRAAPMARAIGGPQPDFLLEAARVARESLVGAGTALPSSRASSRPPRKAAAKALQRSLEWAHGVQWIEEDGAGGLHMHGDLGHRMHPHVASRSMSDTSATSGITAQASDRAEEVAFEPRHANTDAHLFGRDTQAAVDLLTLCHGHHAADNSVLSVRPTTPDDGPPHHHHPHMPAYPLVSPLAASLDAHDGALAAERLAKVVELSLPTSLPAEALDAVAAARDAMVAAFRGKEQADLAVRTVAKMLATKQDEARVQQQRVQRAIARFHAALQDVDTQCGAGAM